MAPDDDEPVVWYNEELEQGWFRLEDSLGRSHWHLLSTDHTQRHPPCERR